MRMMVREGNKDGIDCSIIKDPLLREIQNNWIPFKECAFSAMLPENIPPVASGFPADDTFNVPCRGSLDLTVAFATPEEAQEIMVTLPPNIGSIPGLTYNMTTSNAGEIRFN
jgi:hypothetical protein